jgi:hypothetical protein
VDDPDAAQNESLPSRVVVDIPDNKTLRIENVGGGSPGWMPALITGLAALLTSIIALIATLTAVGRTNRQNANNTTKALEKATENATLAINQKANELEIAALEKWLSEFFGPFIQLSQENKRLAELLRSRQGDDNFRTLKALLDSAWNRTANSTDLQLVDQIVRNGLLLRSLIRKKAGPVSPAVQEVLAKASAHFTILDMANRGLLTEKTESFGEYVYPRDLDGILDAERVRVESRRDLLRSNLSKAHPPLEGPAAPLKEEG